MPSLCLCDGDASVCLRGHGWPHNHADPLTPTITPRPNYPALASLQRDQSQRGNIANPAQHPLCLVHTKFSSELGKWRAVRGIAIDCTIPTSLWLANAGLKIPLQLQIEDLVVGVDFFLGGLGDKPRSRQGNGDFCLSFSR